MPPFNIDDIMQSIERLKPMPSNVSLILREIEKQDLTIETLAGMIGLDQVLAALVLQMSNSVSLGYSRTCSTLQEAIMYIGLQRVKSILISSSAAAMMNNSLKGYRLGAGELWQHSLVVAVASEWLARMLRYPNPEQAYVSGLLHDIGKLLLDQSVLNNYVRITDYVEKYHVQIWQAEERMIGIDHARVGGLIAEHWNFPIDLADSIRFHHAPSFSKVSQRLAAIVNLANSFSEDYQQAKSALLSFSLHPETLHILRLMPKDMQDLKLKIKASGIFPGS